MPQPHCPHFHRARPARHAFTLIELLVVIAIIAILASILFPVFAQARERARVATSQSNLKQFMLAIHQYTQDYDDGMPLCVRPKDAVGPAMVDAGHAPEQFGTHIDLQPYVKSLQIFQAPVDNGFARYAPEPNPAMNAGLHNVPTGAKIWEAYGTSYKFTQQNFSINPAGGGVWPRAYRGITNGNRVKGAPYAAPHNGVAPPFPLPLSYFARPSETRVLRVYMAPWEIDEPGYATSDDPGRKMHPHGTVVAFADGHVKMITSPGAMNKMCDGPTWSPIRNEIPGHGGDGSCNSGAHERRSQ